MCGIVGIVKLDPRETVEEARLKRMRDVLRHRGPDGEGLWIEGPVGLGHRRLSIVDVEGGQQPMTNEDGAVWITYNGEIYNHAALRPGLEAKGHRYQTRSDTETIVHLYEEEGDTCVERLQGMFAFALWDRKGERLLLARDRLGIKPLYYAVNDRELLFASEIKAILAVTAGRPALNPAAVPEFLATRFLAGDETFFQGIRKLPPGHVFRWSRAGGPRRQRYWSLPTGTDELSAGLAERTADLQDRLEATVRSHLMSDVPLGLFLSGGLDSTGLAALMAPMASDRIRTFAVGFDDAASNELPFARMAARAVGAQHHEVVLSADDFFQALPRLIWHEDEPIAFPSSIALHFVSQLARSHVKVVLTGEGADELFLGYNWYRLTAWNEALGRRYWAWTPAPARRGIRRAVSSLPRALRRYASRSFLALDPGVRAVYHENFAVFQETWRRDLLVDRRLAESTDPYREQMRYFAEASGSTLERMSHADLQTYLVELLMKQDQMSMAASVESRVPFLDHRLVEHVVRMPVEFKVRGITTKVVLREALRNRIPREILRRRKLGFPVPLGRWARERYAPFIRQIILGPRALARGMFDPQVLERLLNEHEAGVANHTDRLWLLLNLEIWHRIFIDGEEPAALASA
ncbi:MAG TPA: asparagine synthase (glutamine-hydrolyzing) [Methylomirabilota bacterium]|nr:asparagine synthase (glutamine-hydrolyzing) [Methylomirabilota bacterium]